MFSCDHLGCYMELFISILVFSRSICAFSGFIHFVCRLMVINICNLIEIESTAAYKKNILKKLQNYTL